MRVGPFNVSEDLVGPSLKGRRAFHIDGKITVGAFGATPWNMNVNVIGGSVQHQILLAIAHHFVYVERSDVTRALPLEPKMSDANHNEPKAKQILSEFKGRLTLIERMTARLRPLRPPVCTSRRLFDYFEIPDPYHPIDFNKPYKPEVGSTKLVLGENRRPVAPHAKVPELKPRIGEEKPKAPQAFRPQGIPSAPTRDSRHRPDSIQSKLTPKPNQKPEFGGGSNHAVTKLPVRPDLAQSSGDAQNAGKTPEQPLQRSIPRPPSSKANSAVSKSGRMRMRRSVISNQQPVIKQIAPETAQATEHPASNPTPAKTPVDRSPSAASGSGGLDDLFGFGSQEGRMRIPRATRSKAPSQPSQPSSPKPSPQSPQSNHQPNEPVQEKQVKRELPKVAPPTSPVNRSPSAASGSGGLDDLFGFGSQEGRMKIPRKSSEKSSGKPKSIFDKNPVQKPTDGKK